jgi:hypothetical protein
MYQHLNTDLITSRIVVLVIHVLLDYMGAWLTNWCSTAQALSLHRAPKATSTENTLTSRWLILCRKLLTENTTLGVIDTHEAFNLLYRI